MTALVRLHDGAPDLYDLTVDEQATRLERDILTLYLDDIGTGDLQLQAALWWWIDDSLAAAPLTVQTTHSAGTSRPEIIVTFSRADGLEFTITSQSELNEPAALSIAGDTDPGVPLTSPIVAVTRSGTEIDLYDVDDDEEREVLAELLLPWLARPQDERAGQPSLWYFDGAGLRSALAADAIVHQAGEVTITLTRVDTGDLLIGILVPAPSAGSPLPT
jgi:hypothetical protein